jgi:internalin A
MERVIQPQLDEALKRIAHAQDTNDRSLNLSRLGLTELPGAIWKLTHLRGLILEGNSLTTLPETIGELAALEILHLDANRLTTLPKAMGRLTHLRTLFLFDNPLDDFSGLDRLSRLADLGISVPAGTTLPTSIRELRKLTYLGVAGDVELPIWLKELSDLRGLYIGEHRSTPLPEVVGELTNLQNLYLHDNSIAVVPDWIAHLRNLEHLDLSENQLLTLPDWIGDLHKLRHLDLESNALTSIPSSLARLTELQVLALTRNPLTPALQSARAQGLDALKAYLRSLDNAEPLYEAKLVLVGEGNVGKTTLLKALSGKEPRKNEPTTHGVSIDIQSMHLPHPDLGTPIQFNAWDFGGQEVYRVTHQFFFSRRSVYLLVWEPRMGVQQCQVEDWLKLIRMRVGDDARVIIVSTHAKTGQRIARIDKPVLQRAYGSMIVDFIEIDSLEDFGIAELRNLIAEVAKGLEHMGMAFNIQWKEARDEALALGQRRPRVAYSDFAALCVKRGLDDVATLTLARLMHDLGYIVYYGDDERLKDDVVLQPEWLTKAIGFVLEDRTTQEQDGILRDEHLSDVWLHHKYENEPRYPAELYPFFLRLMEKYDVSYRLESGDASLVAQHVPQVRPFLPWLPDEEPSPNMRRLAMVCALDEAPPGLIPWLIVRTHLYAAVLDGHRLHWQKGMFLRRKTHGEALVELRDRELHFHAEAAWPQYFMNVLRQTLEKLITDNWPGMAGRYKFKVPCRATVDGGPCQGRFDIQALQDFLQDGDDTIRCQDCRTRQQIIELLFGFEDEEPRAQLARIESNMKQGFAGVESQLANSVMAIMRGLANEAKDGPRLFDLRPDDGNWRRPIGKQYRLRLWCEADDSQHPVFEPDRGSYELTLTREWVRQVAPYVTLVATILKTVLPMVAPAVNVLFGAKTMDDLGIKDHLELMEKFAGQLSGDLAVTERSPSRGQNLSDGERHGLLALHALLRQLDPTHERLGLHRVPTYTGDFQWLCRTHYNLTQSKIPDRIPAVQ